MEPRNARANPPVNLPTLLLLSLRSVVLERREHAANEQAPSSRARLLNGCVIYDQVINDQVLPFHLLCLTMCLI